MEKISVIIPTFNEEVCLKRLLIQVQTQAARLGNCEIIVADGSSTDSTVGRAKPYATVVESPRNRGLQLNRAVQQAHGEILCFLHADVALPEDALASLRKAMADPAVVGGSFSLEFTGDGIASRVFTVINEWRRWFGIFYGDSGIFVRRVHFDRLGGFQNWPVLEDYEFARRLIKAGKTVCLPDRLKVSSRRWQPGPGGRRRLFRTMASWFFIQTSYFLGVPIKWLACWYPAIRARPHPQGEPQPTTSRSHRAN
jgi:rSAM/selenodomain-associated transferase 2